MKGMTLKVLQTQGQSAALRFAERTGIESEAQDRMIADVFPPDEPSCHPEARREFFPILDRINQSPEPVRIADATILPLTEADRLDEAEVNPNVP